MNVCICSNQYTHIITQQIPESKVYNILFYMRVMEISSDRKAFEYVAH